MTTEHPDAREAEPFMCVPCDRCGEHLLVTEGTSIVGHTDDESRRRLRAALTLGTHKLRCLRCDGARPHPTNSDRGGVIAHVIGPFRPIDYRLGRAAR